MEDYVIPTKSRKQYISELVEAERKRFSQHVIGYGGDREWVLNRPEGGSIDKVCVMATRHRELVVSGDVELVSFALGPQEPSGLVSWGGGFLKDLDYAVSKAMRGTTCDAMCVECIEEVTAHDGLGALALDIEDAWDEEEANGKSTDSLLEVRSALERVVSETTRKNVSDLASRLPQDCLFGKYQPFLEWLGDGCYEGRVDVMLEEVYESNPGDDPVTWGEVPSRRIIVACAALERLSALLDSQAEPPAEPPE